MKLKYELILASNSPRRKQLLEERGFKFKILSAEIDEKFSPDLSVDKNVQKLAHDKVSFVLNRYSVKDKVIIGADTVVVYDNKILGKPVDIIEAKIYLTLLSDNWHVVFSGIAVYNPENKSIITDYEKTAVKFAKLNDEMVNFYIKNFQPMDKAGAYGIQDFGAFFVEKIDGCFFNVVGLPLYRLFSILRAEKLFIFK